MGYIESEVVLEKGLTSKQNAAITNEHFSRTAREIFNPRIVPDSLIFISVAAARWPGPQLASEPPAYCPPTRAAKTKSERVRECE